jgi:outer membrane protein TolC
MRSTVALMLALVVPAVASGQPPDGTPRPLALEEAIARGLEASERIAELTARARAADAAADERLADRLPAISLQAGYLRTNHVDAFGVLLPSNQLRVIYPDIPDNYRTRVDVQWPLYTGGRRESAERAARREATATTLDVDTARADRRLEIERGYWALVTAVDAVRVVDEALVRTRAHLQDARNQLDAGLVAPNEVLAVEAQESHQRMLGVQARASRDIAEAELARLIGLSPGSRIQPTTPLVAPDAPDLPLDGLIEQALASRSERSALVERVSAASETAGSARAATRPVVSLAGGADYARPNPRIFPRDETWRTSWDAGVAVSWPVFDGGRARAGVAQTTALLDAARARLQAFDADVALEVRRRVSELEAGLAAIAAAGDGVRAAAEARRIAGDRFAAGVATSTDVVDAQVALLQAELDRTQATASARLAAARLARAVGN